MILLDTSVLSAALRRPQPGAQEKAVAERLQTLLDGGERVCAPGIVVQELLSGIKDPAQFERIKGILLRGYPVLTATLGDHVLAAEVANKCRKRGVAVSTVDGLIAAIAINAHARLFTTDQDFDHIAQISALRLLD